MPRFYRNTVDLFTPDEHAVLAHRRSCRFHRSRLTAFGLGAAKGRADIAARARGGARSADIVDDGNQHR
jgi:hypothetical protein